VRHLPSTGGHCHRKRDTYSDKSDPVWGGIWPARSAAEYHLCGIRAGCPGCARTAGRIHHGRRGPGRPGSDYRMSGIGPHLMISRVTAGFTRR